MIECSSREVQAIRWKGLTVQGEGEGGVRQSQEIRQEEGRQRELTRLTKCPGILGEG